MGVSGVNCHKANKWPPNEPNKHAGTYPQKIYKSRMRGAPFHFGEVQHIRQHEENSDTFTMCGVKCFG